MGDPVASSADSIIRAAEEAFATMGYHRTSLEYIAVRAGITATELTEQFPDKAGLLLAALTQRDDRDGSQVQIFDQPGGLELLAGLKAMVRATADRASAALLHTVISADALTADHPAQQWARERYQWTQSLFTGALRRDQHTGLINADLDPRSLALRIIAVMDGLQLQWLLAPDEVDMSAEFDAYIDELVDDIRVVRD